MHSCNEGLPGYKYSILSSVWHDLQYNGACRTNEADASWFQAEIGMQPAAQSLCHLLLDRVGKEGKLCIVCYDETGWHEYLRA